MGWKNNPREKENVLARTLHTLVSPIYRTVEVRVLTLDDDAGAYYYPRIYEDRQNSTLKVVIPHCMGHLATRVLIEFSEYLAKQLCHYEYKIAMPDDMIRFVESDVKVRINQIRVLEKTLGPLTMVDEHMGDLWLNVCGRHIGDSVNISAEMGLVFRPHPGALSVVPISILDPVAKVLAIDPSFEDAEDWVLESIMHEAYCAQVTWDPKWDTIDTARYDMLVQKDPNRARFLRLREQNSWTEYSWRFKGRGRRSKHTDTRSRQGLIVRGKNGEVRME